MDFIGTALPLTSGAVADVARRWKVDQAWIWGLVDTESAGGGFQPNHKPKILYEAHVFGRLTKHEFDAEHPNVSASAWNRSLYGASGEHQYERLAEAMELNEEAALQSCSWGMFQILGLNFKACGFANVEDYVAAQCIGEDEQLKAFVAFCEKGGLDAKLRAGDIEGFVKSYNGPGQVEHYSSILQANAAKHMQPDRKMKVKLWQRQWNQDHPKSRPLVVDGIAGPKTIEAGWKEE